MPFTRRRPETFALVLLAGTTLLASCVIEETMAPVPDGADAGDAAPSYTPPSANGDAGSVDASADAPTPRPGPRVECPATGPCATALRSPAARWQVDRNTPLGMLPPLSETFCALLASGKVACWGDNRQGQLGRSTEDIVSAPGFVADLDGAVDLDRGCAVLAGEHVKCWGTFVAPSLGSGDGDAAAPGARMLALPPVKRIRMTSEIGCVLLSDHRVECWGLSRASGQMAYAPDETSDAGVYGPASVPLSSTAEASDIALGAPSKLNTNGYEGQPFGGATFVLLPSGKALSWGDNRSLGRTSSLIPDPSPTEIELVNVGAITTAGAAACVIAGGNVSCWGNRGPTPEPMGIYDAVSVATAGPAPFGRGCAVVRSGEVHCWGTNDFGQAGDGTDSLARLPVKVDGLPERAAAVEVTQNSSCALLVSGEIYCWGDGSSGQLGRDVPSGSSFVPQKVTLPEGP